MIRFSQYYGRLDDVRGHLTGLPPWARVIVAIAAIPGLVLLLLSIVVFAVSLLALLLLAAPAYAGLRRLLGGGFAAQARPTEPAHSGAKRVEATVVE
jgi:hypothetical protein